MQNDEYRMQSGCKFPSRLCLSNTAETGLILAIGKGRCHNWGMLSWQCFRLIVFIAIATFGASCTSFDRDMVLVRDASTGRPIEGAKVSPIYPSFVGGSYTTNDVGVAHVGLFGLPRGGCGVDVEAPGYMGYFFDTGATAERPGGWRGDNLDIILLPATQPTEP